MGLLSLSKALIKASLKRNKTRRIFQTEYDVIVDVVKEHGKIYVKELARFLKYDVNELEKITNLLVKHDILKVNYPLNVFSEPTLSLGSYHKKKIHCPVNAERVLNTYEINADYVLIMLKPGLELFQERMKILILIIFNCQRLGLGAKLY